MRRTIHFAAILAAILGVSHSAAVGAGAATLSIVPNKTTYAVGESVVVQLVGDPQGASDVGIFGMLRFDPSILVADSVVSLTPTSNAGATPWVPGVKGCGSDFCSAINALGSFTPLPVDQTGSQVWATVTLHAIAAGSMNLSLETLEPGYELSFFDLTSTADAPIQVVTSVVPAVGAIERGLLVLLLGAAAAWVLRARSRGASA